jgi:hypothetical protein
MAYQVRERRGTVFGSEDCEVRGLRKPFKTAEDRLRRQSWSLAARPIAGIVGCVSPQPSWQITSAV